ncbi:hypothetical protein NXS98_16340 [Fontisphaera persica]|uniref:hypothetical protein n=1 Tax=Fontisphaera persica TaxID=2974023 RepID=UPI0024C0D7CA|nr:hypothetical protein [Fontisphaera persica]WCJ59268.1 hypothetical protein NXS98_16340 [Fontisphaera persica]
MTTGAAAGINPAPKRKQKRQNNPHHLDFFVKAKLCIGRSLSNPYMLGPVKRFARRGRPAGALLPRQARAVLVKANHEEMVMFLSVGFSSLAWDTFALRGVWCGHQHAEVLLGRRL